jgi:hypothetical protein
VTKCSSFLSKNVPSDYPVFVQLPISVPTEGKFLATKFEFGGSFGVSLEGDCHELEVTPNLE